MFIAKLQKSLESSNGKTRVLIYNESKTIIKEQEITKELEKLFGSKNKLFAKCSLNGKKEIVIGDLVKDQGW